jgi:hypothetical protein
MLIRSIDVFKFFDLPYELIEMIVEKMVIKEKLLKNLKFPKLYYIEHELEGTRYRLQCGVYTHYVYIRDDGGYSNVDTTLVIYS